MSNHKKPMGFRAPDNNPKPEPIIDKYENKLVDTCEVTRLDSSDGSHFIDTVNEFLEDMGNRGWKITSVAPSPMKGHSQIWFTRKKAD